MTSEIFALALARAQRAENLSPALYSVLASIAAHMKRNRAATIPTLAINLGVTFNAIQQHLHKSPQLFEITKNSKRLPGINIITLSQEGINLLVTIDTKCRAYGQHLESELEEYAS